MSISGYQTLLPLFDIQYHNLPLPLGKSKNVFFPKDPAIWAFVLLMVITKSQTSINEIRPFKSLKLSIFSIFLILILFSL